MGNNQISKKKHKNMPKNITESKIYDSVLDLIGNTPLVRLNKIPNDYNLSCKVYVKCEFLNPAGSIKDRIAKYMIEDAYDKGIVDKTTTFVEPTSGNTGISIALNTTLSGNKSIVVTEQKNSLEKVNTIRLLGSEVIYTKDNITEFEVAHKLVDENENMHMLNQFENEVNTECHYNTTAVEILSALEHVDMIVMGAGTGGTFTGVAAKVKATCPDCLFIAAEPKGSTMINLNCQSHPFLVEGIGGTWTPKIFDKTLIDSFEVVTDEESFLMARELAMKEGLLCGGSSGAAMCAAIKAIQRHNIGPDKHVVVVLPDGIRNYMTKFVTDQWMEARLFLDPPQQDMKWWKEPITKIKTCHKYPLVKENFTCAEALNLMKENIAIVVDNAGYFVGAISKDSFRNYATNPTKISSYLHIFDFDNKVTEHLVKQCYTLAKNGKKGMPTLGRLARMLDITPFVVIGTKGYHESGKDITDYFIPEGVVTGDDILDYIYQQHTGALWL